MFVLCVSFNKVLSASSGRYQRASLVQKPVQQSDVTKGCSSFYQRALSILEPRTDQYKSTSLNRLLTLYVYYRQEWSIFKYLLSIFKYIYDSIWRNTPKQLSQITEELFLMILVKKPIYPMFKYTVRIMNPKNREGQGGLFF